MKNLGISEYSVAEIGLFVSGVASDSVVLRVAETGEAFFGIICGHR